jgi:hypothetical protein
MKAIELWDLNDHVFLTLADVLAPLPERAFRSTWDVSDFVDPDGEGYFEVGYNGDDIISTLANTGRRTIGSELVLLAKSSSQVIWATFRGYDPGDATEPWIWLHAIDSTFWRCETRDAAIRQALMKSFRDVRSHEL